MKRAFLVVALMVTVFLSALTPAAGQDAVKAEIRQAIEAAYLNAYLNAMDVKAFLAGWDHGAISPRFVNNGDLVWVAVTEWIAGDVREDRKAPEKKEFRFLYPAIDVTGGMAMAQVEGPFCDINLYLPEIDLVTKLDLTPVFATTSYVKSHADHRDPRPPVKTSAFTLIGITGNVAGGKLAVTFDRGPVMTMYVALYKLKTGWAVVQIATDKQPWMVLFLPQ